MEPPSLLELSEFWTESAYSVIEPAASDVAGLTRAAASARHVSLARDHARRSTSELFLHEQKWDDIDLRFLLLAGNGSPRFSGSLFVPGREAHAAADPATSLAWLERRAGRRVSPPDRERVMSLLADFEVQRLSLSRRIAALLAAKAYRAPPGDVTALLARHGRLFAVTRGQSSRIDGLYRQSQELLERTKASARVLVTEEGR